MKNFILVEVSDEALKRLQEGTARVHGTIGRSVLGYDFHEHDRSQSNGAKNRFVHKLKHGRLEMTEKRTSLSIRIPHAETTPDRPYEGQEGMTAAKIIGREAQEAARFLNQQVFNLNYDNPYGVRVHQ